MSTHNSSDDDSGEYDSLEKNLPPSKNVANGDYDKPGMLQRGVLRTNCIDCLDRTNVAQYAYGWAALGQQLHALGIRDVPTIELDDRLSSALMGLYERMGDTLAYQYGGSAAHNKVISFLLFFFRSILTYHRFSLFYIQGTVLYYKIFCWRQLTLNSRLFIMNKVYRI